MVKQGTELLVAWLNDAYAMEQAQIEMLERYIKDFATHEEIKLKLEEHLEETKDQAIQVKTCLEGLDANISQSKSLLGTMVGALQGMGTGPYKDELVKNLIIIHAGEHFEHITYLAIAAAAHTLGEDAIASICTAIAEQEKSMAEWSERPLQLVVDDVLGYKTETP